MRTKGQKMVTCMFPNIKEDHIVRKFIAYTVLLVFLLGLVGCSGEDHGNGLEPNHTYDDYTCVMTRLSSADIFWEIAEFGND